MTFLNKSLGLAVALLLSTGAVDKAAAQTASPPPMGEAELRDLRGGYLSAGGVIFDFGAVVRTYVDGRLALESRLTWTDSGAATSHTAGMDVAGSPYAVVNGANLGGIDLTGLDGAQGLVLTGSNGATALIHDVTGGSLQNLIVNSADGRDLRQEIEINLALPQLDMMQGAADIDRLGGYISQDLNASIIRALGGN